MFLLFFCLFLVLVVFEKMFFFLSKLGVATYFYLCFQKCEKLVFIGLLVLPLFKYISLKTLLQWFQRR